MLSRPIEEPKPRVERRYRGIKITNESFLHGATKLNSLFRFLHFIGLSLGFIARVAIVANVRNERSLPRDLKEISSYSSRQAVTRISLSNFILKTNPYGS